MTTCLGCQRRASRIERLLKANAYLARENRRLAKRAFETPAAARVSEDGIRGDVSAPAVYTRRGHRGVRAGGQADRVLTWLDDHPSSTSAEIAAGVELTTQQVTQVLQRMRSRLTRCRLAHAGRRVYVYTVNQETHPCQP